MKPTDKRRPTPEDSGFDELLRDFFANEMPADLQRCEGAVPTVPAPRKFAASTVRKRAPFVQLAAVAVCLLLASVAFWVTTNRRPNHEPIDGIADGNIPSTPNGIPNLAKSANRPAGFSLSESVEPVESLTYDTHNGPVEQRTNLSTTNVSFIEPTTGDLLELAVPELTIEIFPISDAPASAPNAGPGVSKEKKNAGGSPVLLPEQQNGPPPRL